MRTSRTSVWLVLMLAALLVVLSGCGGSSNSSANNNGNNSGGSNPGSSNPGNGGGSSSAAQFLYTGSLSSGVGAFSIAPNSGALAAVPGQPFTSGLEPDSLATVGSKYLYVGIGQQPGFRGSNCADNVGEIDSFTIGTNGALTPLAQTKISTYCIGDILADPNGQNLYVFSNDRNTSAKYVHMFAIDGNTGALTELQGSPMTTTITRPGQAIISSDGRFIYATDDAFGRAIAVFARNASTGMLTEQQVAPLGLSSTLSHIALAGNGRYIVGTGFEGNQNTTVYVFAVDQNSGNVSGPTPVSNSNTADVVSAIGDRSGKFVFMSQFASNTISTWSIDGNGGLTFVSSVSAPPNPLNMAIDTAGRYLYVETNAPSIAAYSIDQATGKLTAVAGSPFSTPSLPIDMLAVSK